MILIVLRLVNFNRHMIRNYPVLVRIKLNKNLNLLIKEGKVNNHKTSLIKTKIYNKTIILTIKEHIK
jgi:hypothetical protein